MGCLKEHTDGALACTNHPEDCVLHQNGEDDSGTSTNAASICVVILLCIFSSI